MRCPHSLPHMAGAGRLRPSSEVLVLVSCPVSAPCPAHRSMKTITTIPAAQWREKNPLFQAGGSCGALLCGLKDDNPSRENDASCITSSRQILTCTVLVRVRSDFVPRLRRSGWTRARATGPAASSCSGMAGGGVQGRTGRRRGRARRVAALRRRWLRAARRWRTGGACPVVD